jgi:NAD(P)-dependent dehydrogenase (short-subunit alcohol dehydrogenase family)
MSDQKVAYVTGGMGGIGTAICQRLHKEGFKVIAGCGPSRDHVKWIDEQKAQGFTFYASVGNVGDWDSTVEAFTKTKAEHAHEQNGSNRRDKRQYAGIAGEQPANSCRLLSDDVPFRLWIEKDILRTINYCHYHSPLKQLLQTRKKHKNLAK